MPIKLKTKIEELDEGFSIALGADTEGKVTGIEYTLARGVEKQLRTILAAVSLMEKNDPFSDGDIEDLLAHLVVDAGAATVRQRDN